MAVIETMTGLALLVWPQLLAWLLLGSLLEALPAIIVARIGGVALISLATACWFAALDENSRAASGLMAAMVIYNCGATILLAYAGMVLGLTGLGLWPAVIVHVMLTIGCIGSVKSLTFVAPKSGDKQKPGRSPGE